MPPAAGAAIAPIETPSYSMLFSPAASSLASPTVELQVHWEPAQIRSELRMATTILSHRGLKLAAKWTSEQLVGLVRTDGTMDSSTAGGGDMATMKGLHAEMSQLQDRDWYAKSLLELGEYLHAASVLSQPNDDVTCMTPPLEDASHYGIYLRAYALYLAGERRKEQDYLELQRYERRDAYTHPYDCSLRFLNTPHRLPLLLSSCHFDISVKPKNKNALAIPT